MEVTVDLRAGILYLDEAGHIYLPLVGPSQTCLRLNKTASTLWRQWLRAPVDVAALTPGERRLLDDLLGKGALRGPAEPAELAPEARP